jgi:GMP synthase-like glutamine amidotransferase
MDKSSSPRLAQVNVLVIANREDPDSGYVGDALLARGAELTTTWRDDLTTVTELPQDVDLVVSLGSDWHVYDPSVAPSVEREAAYLRATIDAGTPVLGICFGAQVLAHALGGEVRKDAGGGEIGWYVVESDDPTIPEGPYVQWHSDVFTTPPGAVELARSPVGPQAFSYGSAFAVQFHPEVTPAVLQRWAMGGRSTLEQRGIDPGTLVAEAQRQAGAAQGRAEALVEAFLTGEFTR